MREQLQLLPAYLSAHLQLVLLALLCGIAVSIPLGVIASRVRSLERAILGVASVIQTIPSLALLAFLVPALSLLGLENIGFLPAFIGLFLYSILPILRNTVTGLLSVDSACIEAAQAVGMTPRQQLLRVMLPLSFPVIIAGVRTASVWTVGTATLATPVGATSLGNYIFSGLQTKNYAAVLTGCLASAALALILDGLVRALEVAYLRRHRLLLGVALCGVLALSALALWPLLRARGERAPIRIGTKTFTEQYILGRILSGHIERRTGQPVRIIDSLGSTVAFDALRGGAIDAYVDYTGTLYTLVLRRRDLPTDRSQVLAEVRAALLREYGIVVVAALGFENSYALAMRSDEADRRQIRNISDLIPHAPALAMGGDYEIFQRPEWQALKARYGLAFRELRSMDPSLMFQAVQQRGVELIAAYSTDGRIATGGLRVLLDDRRAIPPYDAVVLASASLQKKHPEVLAALSQLEGAFTEDRMRRMNAEVDEGKGTPAEVAARFLAER